MATRTGRGVTRPAADAAPPAPMRRASRQRALRIEPDGATGARRRARRMVSAAGAMFTAAITSPRWPAPSTPLLVAAQQRTGAGGRLSARRLDRAAGGASAPGQPPRGRLGGGEPEPAAIAPATIADTLCPVAFAAPWMRSWRSWHTRTMIRSPRFDRPGGPGRFLSPATYPLRPVRSAPAAMVPVLQPVRSCAAVSRRARAGETACVRVPTRFVSKYTVTGSSFEPSPGICGTG